MNNRVLDLVPMKIINQSGFISIVDLMPRVLTQDQISNGIKCDSAIVQAARVSYGSGTKTKQSDQSLIKYLFRNQHTTPFEMVKFKFHVRAPLFVTRQWQRHRMGTFNEISARYSVMDDSYWSPEAWRTQGTLNKQGSSKEYHDPVLTNEYNNTIGRSFDFYSDLLKEGVSREMARCVLPVSMNTEFYWSVDLHNLLKFIHLRSDSHAQPEIREYSDQIKEIIREYCPTTIEAFEEYSQNSIRLSKKEIEIIAKIQDSKQSDAINHEADKAKYTITSVSELNEFKHKLRLLNIIQ